MKKLARYSLSLRGETREHVSKCLDELTTTIHNWLKSKGDIHPSDGHQVIAYNDGRTATLADSRIEVSGGILQRWSVLEPIDNGLFKTSIGVCYHGDRVAFSCELEAGSLGTVLTPADFDPFCPRLVRDVIGLSYPWHAGSTPVASHAIRCYNVNDGITLAGFISDKTRTIPVVVLSELDGNVLHDGLEGKIASDLAGLAIVLRVSSDSAWAITEALGSYWSCYNGAIRIYWPIREENTDPFKHPLWTANKLMEGMPSRAQAAARIRTQFRRKILELSTLSMRQNEIFKIVEEIHQSDLMTLKKESKDQCDWVFELETDNAKLTEDNRLLKTRIEQLENELATVKAMLAWEGQEEIGPDEQHEPSTVLEAYQMACADFFNELYFGEDIPTGISDLNETAGPPGKIFKYLEGLAELSKVIQAGDLVGGSIQWLADKGYKVSRESKTIRQTKTEMEKRRWRVGASIEQFEYHMKPSDATSIDRCVRIYFAWNEQSRKIAVGWIGRHP